MSGVATPDQFEGQLVQSLKETYNNFGERFRALGREQFGHDDQPSRELTPEETTERQKLEVMAGFGLFDPSLTEDGVKAREVAYKAHIEAEAIELADPKQLKDEYEALNRELSGSGLGPEKLARWGRLGSLKKQRKF